MHRDLLFSPGHRRLGRGGRLAAALVMRSSHTWFVLKYLLGYDNVKNYYGSWTEWGNLVGAPIEKEIPAVAR